MEKIKEKKQKPSPKKRISRKKPHEKNPIKYFDENTQAAIIKYQQENDVEQKNLIYVQEILPAFIMLVQNLINVYGFHVAFESKEDLRNECLEFLYGVLPKFDSTRGFKAFSYFNVVAKHWLTVKNKQSAKNIQICVSFENKDALTKEDLGIIEEHNLIPSIEDTLTQEELSTQLRDILSTFKERSKTEIEMLVLNAIHIIVSNIQEIELLSKRALMIYLREITYLPNKQLSSVLSGLRKQYKEIKKEIT